VANALTLGTYLTGTSFNGSSAVTATVDATSANTASKVVARDASGDFSAGTITATLTGNATNVSGTVAIINGGTGETTRQAAMDALAGGTTSGQYLRGNGSDVVMSTIQVADVPTLNQSTTGNATTATTATNLAGGSAGTVPYQSAAGTTVQLAAGTSGQVLSSNGAAAPSWLTSTNANTASAIVQRDASGNFSAGTITAALTGNVTGNVTGSSGSTTGNAATATTLQTARTINGTSFNGSANITITANTTNTLTLGTYLTGTSFNGSAAVTAAVDATTTNTASKVVARDASGNFAAGTITASLTGNASGSAATFTSTSQNSQFNSIGVGTAGSGTAGEIRATNSVTAHYSDDRLKTKLGNIEGALAKVKTLSGFYYEANETAQALGYKPKREVGVSAQSVQAVLPEVVVPAPIDEQYLTVHYDKLVPLLIEAIKELEAKVAALEAKG
jgi:hypothetical protein